MLIQIYAHTVEKIRIESIGRYPLEKSGGTMSKDITLSTSAPLTAELLEDGGLSEESCEGCDSGCDCCIEASDCDCA